MSEEDPNVKRIVYMIDQRTAAVERIEGLSIVADWVMARMANKEDGYSLPIYAQDDTELLEDEPDHIYVPLIAVQNGIEELINEWAARLRRTDDIIQQMANVLDVPIESERGDL